MYEYVMSYLFMIISIQLFKNVSTVSSKSQLKPYKYNKIKLTVSKICQLTVLLKPE